MYEENAAGCMGNHAVASSHRIDDFHLLGLLLAKLESENPKSPRYNR